jgi:hypothetical protein
MRRPGGVLADDLAQGGLGDGDDPQRHPPQHVDQRHDQGQAGFADADDPSKAEQHAFPVGYSR